MYAYLLFKTKVGSDKITVTWGGQMVERPFKENLERLRPFQSWDRKFRYQKMHIFKTILKKYFWMSYSVIKYWPFKNFFERPFNHLPISGQESN